MEAWQVCVIECENCNCEFLVREDVRAADRFVCTRCGHSGEVAEVSANYRDTDEPIDLDLELIRR